MCAGGTAAPAPLQRRRVLVRAVQGPLQGAGGSLAGQLVSQAAAAALASRPACPTAACRARGGQGWARGWRGGWPMWTVLESSVGKGCKLHRPGQLAPAALGKGKVTLPSRLPRPAFRLQEEKSQLPVGVWGYHHFY